MYSMAIGIALAAALQAGCGMVKPSWLHTRLLSVSQLYSFDE
jgi:hypothetical protein